MWAAHVVCVHAGSKCRVPPECSSWSHGCPCKITLFIYPIAAARAPRFPAQAFGPNVFTFENYRWAHAIMDSRTIWWNSKRHLVPMLDLINCAEGPTNPDRVHSTRLDKTVRTGNAWGGRVVHCRLETPVS